MRKITFFLVSFFMAMFAFAQDNVQAVSWAAGDLGYDNATSVTEVTLAEGFTMTFAQGTNTSNDPKFYTQAPGTVRIYAGNTVTFSGKDIVKIEMTGTSGYATTLTPSVGEANIEGVVCTWTGKADEITFTKTGSGQFRMASLVLYYEKSAANPLDNMTVSPAEGEVEALSMLSLTFPGSSCTAREDGEISLMKDGDFWMGGFAMTEDDMPSEQVDIEFEGRVTTPGSYVVEVGAGAIVVDGNPLPAFTLNYTIPAPAVNPLDNMTVSPSQGNVEAISMITLTFPGSSCTAREDGEISLMKDGEFWMGGFAMTEDGMPSEQVDIEFEGRATDAGEYEVVVGNGVITVDGTPLPSFTLNYTIQGSSFNPLEVLNINPAEGEVTSLKDFTISFGGAAVAAAQSATITLTKENSEEVVNGTIQNTATSYTVSLDQEVTDFGKYTLNISGGCMTVDGVSIADPLAFKCTVKDPNAKEYSIDPAEGTVTSMQYFTISFDKYVDCDEDAVPTLVNTTTNATYEGGMTASGGGVIVYFGEEITEAGNYVLTIPANTIEVMATGSKYEALTFNYTIEGDEPTDKLVELPEGVVAEEWKATGFFWYYEDSDWTFDSLEGNDEFEFKVAIDGNDFYISGLNVFLPEVFVKGTLSGNIVTFKSGQYAGQMEANGNTYVFYMLGTHDTAPFNADDFQFVYSSTTNTLTAVSGVDPSLGADTTGDKLYNYITGLYLYKPNQSGIENVENANDAVNSVVYDAAGRRVNGTAKGLLIKQTQMSDGTVKTEKVIR